MIDSRPKSRRLFLQASLASVGLMSLAEPARALVQSSSVVAAAKAGLQRAGARVAHADVVGVADFQQPSWQPRLHLVDLRAGKVDSLLVAHGRGSDPGRSGWLRVFSNAPGSDATSQGDFLTGEFYEGEHGHSMRLIGLDQTNCNAESRGIVVHSAWYVGPKIVREQGMVGRSEGCFAVSAADLPTVLDRLGPGRLLVSARI